MGLATICSILINSVLLKQGIPIDSKFGGILQVRNGEPLRFVELIHYSGSSLDPSEIFIRGKMTSVAQVVEKGEGKILANFREIPALSRYLVEDIIRPTLPRPEFTAFFPSAVPEIRSGQTNVDLNKVGMILVGGLNPVAKAHEEGFDVDNKAMSTVMEYEDLRNIEEL